MKNLEQYTTKDIMDYYIKYIMEHELASSKSQARQLLLNALSYNVVREAVVDQIAFLIDADEE